MDKDEALRMALEALEKLWNIIDDIDTYGDMAKNDEKLYRSLVERRQRTRFEETGIKTDGYELSGGAITAIKEALAQPEQEPVAMKFKIYKPTVPDPTRQGINNALLPWVYDQDRSSGFDATMWVTPVATLPPQRTWVGLTHSDIDQGLLRSNYAMKTAQAWRDGVYWAQTKLKEKNT